MCHLGFLWQSCPVIEVYSKDSNKISDRFGYCCYYNPDLWKLTQTMQMSNICITNMLMFKLSLMLKHLCDHTLLCCRGCHMFVQMISEISSYIICQHCFAHMLHRGNDHKNDIKMYMPLLLIIFILLLLQ